MIERFLLCVALAAFLGTAYAQGAPGGGTPPGSPTVPPTQAPAKLQAFVGEWDVTQSALKSPVPHEGEVPLTPAYDKIRAQLESTDNAGKAIPGRNAKCIPAGMPNMMVFGFEIAADAQHITMIGGTGPSFRHIYLDQSKHTPDADLLPSYGGESIAHWEGDTLVIDTIGLDPGNEIFYALPANNDQLHVIEHWRMLSPASMEVVTTIIDPPALMRPWTYRNVYGRRSVHAEIRYCVSANDPFKNGVMNLTPPAGTFVPPGLKP